MIDDAAAERAAAFILDKAAAFARAVAHVAYLEKFLKSKHALLFEHMEGGVKEREMAAYAHDDYLEVLEGLREAVEQRETLRWEITAAQARIDVWRTQQASNRI